MHGRSGDSDRGAGFGGRRDGNRLGGEKPLVVVGVEAAFERVRPLGAAIDAVAEALTGRRSEAGVADDPILAFLTGGAGAAAAVAEAEVDLMPTRRHRDDAGVGDVPRGVADD